MIQHTGTAAINLYLLHCDAELRTEGQTRADQATISISDGGNVCQAYTNNKMGKKQSLASNDKTNNNNSNTIQYNTFAKYYQDMQSIIFVES